MFTGPPSGQLLAMLVPAAEQMLASARERGRITITDAVTLLAAFPPLTPSPMNSIPNRLTIC